MSTYILRRLLMLPILIFLVSAILFFIILQLPVEQRAEVYMPSGNPHKTAEEAQKIMEEIILRNGLDQPFPVQYANWVGNVLRGNLGFSPTWSQPVMEGLLQRAPATIEVALFAIPPTMILALLLGSLAARYQGKAIDLFLQIGAFVGWALPSFILGLVMLKILYARLNWFAPERLSLWANVVVTSAGFERYTGLNTIDSVLNGRWDIFQDALNHLVMPGVTLALVQWGLLMRVMRSSILDTLQKDYIMTARAKGLPESKVVNLHARKNAVLPVISTAGVAMAAILNSIVVIEVIFNINGLGHWAVDAMLNYDIPVSIAFALFACTIVILSSITADILYGVVDPRVRLD